MTVLKHPPHIRAFLLSMAGSVVLIIGMGYGRFAFTGVLPVMLKENLLTLQQGNWAASANYAGYLLGALLLSRARPTDSRRLCFTSVLATLLSIVALAWLRSPLAIIVLRGLAGLFSAVTLIAASLWLLQHMQHTQGAPLLFSGVGMGVFLSAEMVAVGKSLALPSATIWLLCAGSAAVLFLVFFRLLNSPPDTLVNYTLKAQTSTRSQTATAAEAWKLLLIYGLAGFGYIITATYLPLFLTGSLTGVDPVQIWALFGLAAVPSCFFWHRLAVARGYRFTLLLNLILQAVGVILPAFSHALPFCLASALLVGFTFMGTVTVALPEARRLAVAVSFNMIAAMTALYGFGQIAGPLVAGELYAFSGSFNPSLCAASTALVLAAGLVAKR
ncbi:YbfB/YjiJ family MFS transporter [Pantoea rwandensis]|uniref:YbfB/YjiJ family MFS transporter n=1 Tax=Pantoea rwandensis TaxID=1076550 RepID=UPI003CCB8851